MAADGWTVEHRADPIAVEELAKLVRRTAPDLVALSTSLSWLLPEARRACVTLKALPAAPMVAVGGRAYRGDAHLGELVGADLFAEDPRELRARLRERAV
jgi:methanogenic corrinoid protein MtbC1